MNKKILLCDGLNLFIRNFAALNLADDNGNCISGQWGTLQSIRSICDTFKPTIIVFCWEGRHSGKRRRAQMPEYKEGRKVKRSLNRMFQWQYEGQEMESFRAQLYRTKQYLEAMPIFQVEVDFLEADDAIAYITNNLFKEAEKIVISSDKDYFQLINDKVSVFMPVKKELIQKPHLLTEYKCSPSNWIMLKCLMGDASDSVDGIKGLGPKTIVKLFPFLSEDKRYEVDDLLSYSEKIIKDDLLVENQKKVPTFHKHYKEVLKQENIDKLRVNYKVMQLMNYDMSVDAVQKIKDTFTTQKPTFQPFTLRSLFTQDAAYRQVQQFDYWTRIFMPLNQTEKLDIN